MSNRPKDMNKTCNWKDYNCERECYSTVDVCKFHHASRIFGKRGELTDFQIKQLNKELADKYYAAKNCEICNVNFNDEHWRNHKVIDHCHDTDIVRGFLCRGCNQDLGTYELMLKRSLNKTNEWNLYLKKHEKINI